VSTKDKYQVLDWFVKVFIS